MLKTKTSNNCILFLLPFTQHPNFLETGIVYTINDEYYEHFGVTYAVIKKRLCQGRTCLFQQVNVTAHSSQHDSLLEEIG